MVLTTEGHIKVVLTHKGHLQPRATYLTISGRVDRASATEAVDTGSIPGRVKPKTIKIGIHSFPA